jgi:hypothetical protein
LHNFATYLAIVLAGNDATLTTYLPSELLKDPKSAAGCAFGMGLQILRVQHLCHEEQIYWMCHSNTRVGDKAFVASGSTYPKTLRPSRACGQAQYVIRGFTYVNGVMDGECADVDSMTFYLQ